MRVSFLDTSKTARELRQWVYGPLVSRVIYRSLLTSVCYNFDENIESFNKASRFKNICFFESLRGKARHGISVTHRQNHIMEDDKVHDSKSSKTLRRQTGSVETVVSGREKKQVI